jgi:hypothetical protein
LPCGINPLYYEACSKTRLVSEQAHGKKDYARIRADWEKALEINSNYAAARRRLEFLRDEGD